MDRRVRTTTPCYAQMMGSSSGPQSGSRALCREEAARNGFCNGAQRLRASGTPLKNASVVGTLCQRTWTLGGNILKICGVGRTGVQIT